MTGRNRVVVVSSSLYRPNGLTLDRKRNRLYWIDAGYAKLEYLDMNQNKRVLLLSYYYNLYYSFGLTLLGDYLYWTSSSWSRGVYRADKDTGSGITRFVSSTGSLRGIRGYDLSEPFTKGKKKLKKQKCTLDMWINLAKSFKREPLRTGRKWFPSIHWSFLPNSHSISALLFQPLLNSILRSLVATFLNYSMIIFLSVARKLWWVT